MGISGPPKSVLPLSWIWKIKNKFSILNKIKISLLLGKKWSDKGIAELGEIRQTVVETLPKVLVWKITLDFRPHSDKHRDCLG